MSWLGNGVFQLNNGVHTGATVWEQDAAAGTKILASRHDYLDQNLAEGLQNCYTLDSQTTPTANLAMGGFKITGLNVAITARSDVAPVAVVQDGGPLWLGTAGGTADALTFSLTPAITAYVAGQTFRGITGASTNTTTATVAINGLTATTIRKVTAAGKVALVASDIPISSPIEFIYDGTNFVITSGGVAWGPGSFTTLTASSTVTLSPANANVVLSPTGTGVVTINPATAGSMNNVVIGGSTPLAATVTALTATGAVALSPASANVVLSPTGTGVVTINPATAGAMNNVIIGASTPLAATVTTLTANGAVTMSPASLNVTISPSGTGTVTISPVGALTINPTAASTINNASVGVTTAAAGRFTTLTNTSTLTLGATMAAAGNLITTPQIQAYKETKTAPSISAGTLTLDLSGSNVFAVALNANITTFTPSNWPSSGIEASFTLVFTADGTPRTVSWTNVVWAGGTAPTLTSTNAKRDVFTFFSYDAGTTVFGFTAGQNM